MASLSNAGDRAALLADPEVLIWPGTAITEGWTRVAVADDGTTYVADTGNGQLNVFDPSGSAIEAIDRGAAEGNLGLPVGVGIDDHGNVLVVDSSAARVQAYHQLASGQQSPDYINAFGENGSGDAQFQPMYVTLETFENTAREFLRSSPARSFHPSAVNFLPGPVAVRRGVRAAVRTGIWW